MIAVKQSKGLERYKYLLSSVYIKTYEKVNV